MVASDATKDELSDAVDSMIEEVRLKDHSQLFTVAYIMKGRTFPRGTFRELGIITCVWPD